MARTGAPNHQYILGELCFAGKTIVPFCTSHSSGIDSSASSLHTLGPDSIVWSEGRRFEAGTSQDTIVEWLESVGIK